MLSFGLKKIFLPSSVILKRAFSSLFAVSKVLVDRELVIGGVRSVCLPFNRRRESTGNDIVNVEKDRTGIQARMPN